MKQVIWLKLPVQENVRWWQLPAHMKPIPWDLTIGQYWRRGFNSGDVGAEVVTRDGEYTGHIILGETFFLQDMRPGSPATSWLERSDMVGHEFFHFLTEMSDQDLADALGLGKFADPNKASRAIQGFIEKGCK